MSTTPLIQDDIFRFPWNAFPNVWIHADEKAVLSHPDYRPAKTGDSDAAFRLVHAFINEEVLAQIKEFAQGNQFTMASAHALEGEGVNASPEALAAVISERMGWPIEDAIIQVNIVCHTKADGFSRMARQARFDGSCSAGCHYFLVDDFVGQGGTLANLRGWILRSGGRVAGATVLTGKPHSAK